MKNKYCLMIHGGAGMMNDVDEAKKELYFSSLKRILTIGENMLRAGAAAIDVVEECVIELENDELYNAGRGSVLNSKGEVEMDASIMDGKNFKAGAVANIKNIKNPVKLARKVMEQTDHVFLVGEGAMEFAKSIKIESKPSEYFVLASRIKQLQEAKKENSIRLDHDNKKGTVGAVAFDKDGNLAAATSTGGMTNKKYGRVGDSPIIGAGVYADNETCAVSATGIGEQFIRTSLCKTAADFIFFQNQSAQQAADSAIEYLKRKENGLGGIIIIDKQGNFGASFAAEGLIRGWVKEGEKQNVAIW